MPSSIYRPGPPLGAFVDCLWHYDGDPAPADRERALPSGSLDLIINLDADCLEFFAVDAVTPLGPFPGIVLSGAAAGFVTIGPKPRTTVMGVHFRPGGAFPFLGVPAGDLEGTQVPLEALWGPSARDLRERLAEAATPTRRFAILEACLRERARRPLQRHPAVAEALRAFEDPWLESVAQVNARTGLSPRQLIARFRDQVGLAPKAYWRVRRFQAALRRLESARDTRGAEIAAEHGYFDQAHYNRDFRAFTGMSPRAYLARECARPNHVPLRGKNIQDPTA
ncbi:helix-turn-helix domain-containing protein [Polyangium jinanense]|uniref:AraC family transcriptional regulator n=1 Tax=Polyangium jinanense TaxID=2829994 RepID=A0A9X3X715_9BACT|nr:helix-turn-helix domain-containing protein [Polyangium jinanense]MDC3957980.1 AraC family transcriptional regulator [Polyangium jinanense]MDC3983533.1 AraC family transcriptional regulator [Polyangium jinanense]